MRLGVRRHVFFVCSVLGVIVRPAVAQETKDPDQSTEKRIFWVIPNFRTSPTLLEYKALSTGEKFKIARQDAFDRGTVALALLFGGEAS
jgi:hypothetical protein